MALSDARRYVGEPDAELGQALVVPGLVGDTGIKQ